MADIKALFFLNRASFHADTATKVRTHALKNATSARASPRRGRALAWHVAAAHRIGRARAQLYGRGSATRGPISGRRECLPSLVNPGLDDSHQIELTE